MQSLIRTIDFNGPSTQQKTLQRSQYLYKFRSDPSLIFISVKKYGLNMLGLLLHLLSYVSLYQ